MAEGVPDAQKLLKLDPIRGPSIMNQGGTMILEMLQCRACVHQTGARCVAFPDGIPDEIAADQHDHRKAFAGDQGIRFEPKPGMKHPNELNREDKDVRPNATG